MWDRPGPGTILCPLEPMSPALAGGFLTIAPPGKPNTILFFSNPSFMYFPFLVVVLPCYFFFLLFLWLFLHVYSSILLHFPGMLLNFLPRSIEFWITLGREV